MKKRFTILTAAIALLAFLAIPMGMWGQTRTEVVAYTLDGTITGSGSNYATENSITQNGISWKVTGNTTMSPWRIGGKSISNVNRPVYSTNSISDNITKIEVTHGTASGITVNSWTVIVATDASFTNVVSTLTPTFAASATTTINRPAGADWTGCYYKFIYNVTVTQTSNKFIQFVKAEFYKEEGSGLVIATPTFDPAGGDYTTTQNVTISCETQGSTIYYTTDGTTPDNTSTQYTGAITVFETTTIKAIAYVGNDASSVASATYTIMQPLTTMQAIFDKATEVGNTATYTYITLGDWVVSGVSTNGKNVFVTDGTKGFVIFDNGANMGFNAGDVLSGTVYCKVQLYNGFAELTQLNSTTSGLSIATGGTVTAADIAMADLAGVNTGALVHYDNLTCSVDNNKYYLSDGTTTLQVYNAIYAFGSTFVADHIYNITGVYQQYNTTKEVLPRNANDIEEVVSAEPSVTVTPNTINAPAEGADGTLALAYENITDFISFDYYFCDATGEALDEDPEWIYAAINEENDGYSLDYIIYANDGAARTAYLKVYTFDDNMEEVYAIVTVNQAEYVVDYATLPFEWDTFGDTPAGITNSGVSTGNNNAYLKFDTSGDYIVLKINERPGTLTFDIKGNPGSNGWAGTFKVQISADGVNYTDLATYEELLTTEYQEESFANLDENVRYIKWVYTEKVSGNVAVNYISLAAYEAPVPSITVAPALVEVDAEEHDGTLDLTYENLPITGMTDFDIQYYDAEGEEATTPDWIEVLVAEQDPNDGEGYVVSYIMFENEGEARTAYFKVYALDEEAELVYSNLVTITQAAPVAPAMGNLYALYTGDLVEGDYLIVYDGGAMNNIVQSDRLQYEDVTPIDNVITTDNAAIVWHIAPSGDYWTIYSADAEAYAASTGAKNKAQMLADGTDDKAMWTVSGNEIYEFVNKQNDSNGVNANLRKNGTYGFACYSTSTGGALSLYKKVELEIEGYGNSTGGYYLIASPVTVDPATVEGMTEGNFDLYYFDQAEDNEWQNYKDNDETGHFNLVPGKGYLYAHKTDVTLTFTGTPYNGEPIILSKTDGNGIDWPGWNLVGNPYGVMAYLDRDFYTMNDAGDEIIAATNNSVQVMEGVFVIANENGEELTFSTEAPAGSGEKIVVNVSNTNGTLLDRAMIRFGEGGQLPKFQINENSTKLYINEGEEEFAVVRCINESSTPVSFRAAENGTYTLSINTENVEMEYLHLIDNLTGADIDLLATPSYTFESNTTDNADRFAVVYTATTSVNENNAKPFAFFNGSEWVIMNEGNATMQVVDVTGRVISTETLNGNATINLIQVPGVYMIRLVNGNDVKVQKVVVK